MAAALARAMEGGRLVRAGAEVDDGGEQK